jgi:Cys-rich protein (TIGR01571 family)
MATSKVVDSAPAPTGNVVVVQGVVTGFSTPLVGDKDWPAALCCFDNCGCAADLPLCCYATWCTPCLWAELAERLDVSGVDGNPELCGPCLCCTTPRCATNYWALAAWSCASSLLQGALATVLHQSASWARLEPILTSKTRATLERNHGLRRQCCSPCCVHYWCGASALYQEAVYVKHVLKKDFDCCSYKGCCQTSCCCCLGANPNPGEFRGDGYAAVTTQPGMGAV